MTATESITALGSSSWTCRSVIGSVTLMCILLDWPDSLYNSLYICLLFWPVPHHCVWNISGFSYWSNQGIFFSLKIRQTTQTSNPLWLDNIVPQVSVLGPLSIGHNYKQIETWFIWTWIISISWKARADEDPINNSPQPPQPTVSLRTFPIEAIILQDVNMTSQAQKRLGDWNILILSPLPRSFFFLCT